MRKSLTLLILLPFIFSCHTKNDEEKLSVESAYLFPKKVVFNETPGYEMNPVSKRVIDIFINHSGDTLVTGSPIKLEGKIVPTRSDFRNLNQWPVKTNRNIVQKFQGASVRANLLATKKIKAHKFIFHPNDTSYVLRNIKGEKIITAIPLPVQGVHVQYTQPKPVNALSPKTQFNFQNYDIEHGLNASNVLSMLLDRNENIWIGTETYGASKFDGIRFTYFTKEHGLIDNKIHCMLEDRKGNIWFGTNGGVSVFSGRNFTNFTVKEGMSSNVIRCISEDSKGNIWLGSQGGGFAKYDGKSLTHFSISEGLCNKDVNAIQEDDKGVIWLATAKGIAVYDGKKIEVLMDSDSVLNTNYYDILKDKKGNLWFGSSSGLFKFDGNEFSWYTEKEGLAHHNTTSIAEDEFGNLWITSDEGVSEFDGKNFINYTINEGLANKAVKSCIIDSQGNKWLGTIGSGVSVLLQKRFTHYMEKDGLSHHTVYSIMEDKSGFLWFGTEGGGVNKFDGNQFISYTRENGMIGNIVRKVYQDKNGIFWYGMYGGLSSFNGEEYKLEYSSDWVLTILEDDENNIWFGTENEGLIKYDGKIFTRYSMAEGMTNDRIRASFKDSKGNLWFGTWGGGVTKYDGKKFTHFTEREGLINNVVTSVLEDKKGNLWFTTLGGVSCFNGKNFLQYTTAEGLTDNLVYSIIEDYNRNIWLGTEKGLDCILSNEQKIKYGRDTTGISVINFTQENGLNGLDFMVGSSFIDSRNIAWWGTGKSLTSLNLNQFNFPNNPPKISLSHIEVNEEFIDFRNPDEKENLFEFDSVSSHGNYPLNAKFAIDQNHITFHLSAIDWASPKRILYSYKIDDLNDEWSIPSNEAFADYRNLPYGHHVFQVRAYGESKVWSKPFKYSFVILPPWYHTWWTRTFGGILILLLLFFYNKMRMATLKRRQRELEKEVAIATQEIRQQKERAEHSEQIKQQFLANMSHEIRTPMNAVLGMTNLMLETELNEKQNNYLSAIKRSSENLLSIINDILDLSKLEAGKMELEKIPFKLADQIYQVHDTLRFKAEEKGLLCKIDIDSNVPEYLTGDPGRLIQVLINLCGNAIKFTEKGSVGIKVELEEGSNSTLKFIITDTGIGIPEDKIQDLFNAFEQVDVGISRKYGGTGLGLSISKNLVELQGGSISVKSQERIGSEFTMIIPYELADENLIKKSGQRKNSGHNLRGIRILVAEDNQFNQIVINDSLEQLIENVKVAIAENGRIAIDLLEKDEYDVILMDVNMPEMDGIAATKYIRTKLSSDKKDIPIIALTAAILKSEVEKCLDAGMNYFVPKPFKNDELIEILNKVFKRNQE